MTSETEATPGRLSAPLVFLARSIPPLASSLPGPFQSRARDGPQRRDQPLVNIAPR